MTDLAVLGLEIQSQSVRAANDDLKNFQKSADAAAQSAGRFVNASGRMREANGRFVSSAGGLQQAGVGISRAAVLVERDMRRAERAVDSFGRTAAGFLVGGLGALGIGLGVQEIGVRIVDSVRRMEDAQRSAATLRAVLLATGNAANTSVLRVRALAEEMERSTGRAAEETVAVAAQLATFTSIGEEMFEKAVTLANDMSSVFGGDLKSNLDAVARALDAPLEGFAMLQKRGFALSQEEKKLVEQLLRTGREVEAQEVVWRNLNNQVQGAAQAAFVPITAAIQDARKALEELFDVAGNDNEDLVVGALHGMARELRSAKGDIGAIVGDFRDLVGHIQTLAGLLPSLPSWMGGGAAMPEGQTGFSIVPGGFADMVRQGWQRHFGGLGTFGIPGSNASNPYTGPLTAPFQERANWAAWEAMNAEEAARRSRGTGAIPSDGRTSTTYDNKAAERAAKAYEQLIKSALDRNDALRQEIDLVGKTGAAAEALRMEQDLLQQATDRGRTISAAQREEIAKLAAEYGNLTQSLAAAKLAEELLFERQQMGRSSTEQRVYSELRSAGVDIGSAQGQMLAQQIRLNEHLAMGKDLATDFATGFASDLRRGVSAAEAFSNALNRIADKLIDMAINDLVGQAFGGMTGGAGAGGGGGFFNSIGGWLSSIFGGGSPVKAATGGLIRGPGTDTSDNIPAMLSPGEFVFSAAAVRALGIANLQRLHGYARGGYVNDNAPRSYAPAANVVPLQAASPKVEVNFHGATGNERVEESNDGMGGKRIDVYLDEVVGQKLATRGTAANRAVRATTGARPNLIRR